MPKWVVCEEPSYWSDTVCPLPWLSYPVFRHCLTLPIFPSLSSSYRAPLFKKGAGFKPQQQDSWCGQTEGEGEGRGRRDLEKALGYWDKTGERTVTFQRSFHIKSGHVVNVGHGDDLHSKLPLWPHWLKGVSGLTLSHLTLWGYRRAFWEFFLPCI